MANTITFGRFKGQSVRSVPTWYLKWLCQQHWIGQLLWQDAHDEFMARYRRHMAARGNEGVMEEPEAEYGK
jgi:hypothetical protein